VVDICVTSHEYDRSKLRAYAGAAVKEVWLVLVPEKQIEAHRLPSGEQFRERIVHGRGGRASSTALPEFSIDLDALFAAGPAPSR
jgi:Uma2 family endonuclease